MGFPKGSEHLAARDTNKAAGNHVAQEVSNDADEPDADYQYRENVEWPLGRIGRSTATSSPRR